MEVYAIAGGDGAGKTTTALNLTVALREAGVHAAVLDADLGGNVASVLGVEFDATLADAAAGESNVGAAVVEHHLERASLRESDLAAYRASLEADRTQFRAGESRPTETAPDEPDVDTVPVVAGFEDRATHTGADPVAIEDALTDLVMAYEVLVVDTGNGPVSESPVVSLVGGVLTVTTPDPMKGDAALREGRACADAGTRVVGTVANRAGETTSITRLTDDAGTRAVGVIPEDARSPSLEPVTFAVPESPAAAAYGRLAEKLLGWDGASGLLGPTPAASGDRPSGTDIAADGDGTDEDGGGFLSRFLGDD